MPVQAPAAGQDLADVVAVLRKRRWWIAGAALAGLSSATLWTFSVTPQYEAIAQLEVSASRAPMFRDAQPAEIFEDGPTEK